MWRRMTLTRHWPQVQQKVMRQKTLTVKRLLIAQ
jgi:hypothetical protein